MKNLKICGLVKTTLLDYPGHIAATVFLGGCNFRCPFCQNGDIVTGVLDAPEITYEELSAFLDRRAGILEGICVTGGEPTLFAADLEELLYGIKERGYLVKLDSNGTRPDLLRRFAREGLIDYVAMDIKAAPENYSRACGIPISDIVMDRIRESVFWLKNQDIADHEFRTTAVKGIHTAEDFEQIADWLSGCRRYAIQDYAPSAGVIAPAGLSSFTRKELEAFARIVSPAAGSVLIRGI